MSPHEVIMDVLNLAAVPLRGDVANEILEALYLQGYEIVPHTK